jgi:hypothetical protein
MPKPDSAPIFHRRVTNLAELQAALGDACKAMDQHPSEIPFPAQVRIDLTDSQLLFTILKRN